jgi:hypothetical protein
MRLHGIELITQVAAVPVLKQGGEVAVRGQDRNASREVICARSDRVHGDAFRASAH